MESKVASLFFSPPLILKMQNDSPKSLKIPYCQTETAFLAVSLIFCILSEWNHFWQEKAYASLRITKVFRGISRPICKSDLADLYSHHESQILAPSTPPNLPQNIWFNWREHISKGLRKKNYSSYIQWIFI